MEEKDKILKVKKKLIFLFLVYISVAFAMIGSAFLPAFLKEEEEVADFSEIVLSGSKTESQSVKLDLDTLPIYITQTSQKSADNILPARGPSPTRFRQRRNASCSGSAPPP